MCLSLPVLAACPTTRAEASASGTCQSNAAVPPEPSCLPNLLQVPQVPALGCQAAKSREKWIRLQDVGRVVEMVREQKEKAEQEGTWIPFYFIFSNGRHLFCASSFNVRCC